VIEQFSASEVLAVVWNRNLVVIAHVTALPYRVHFPPSNIILSTTVRLSIYRAPEGLLIHIQQQHTVYRTVPAPWSRLFEATAPYTTTSW
jgi:hypothetical protein